MGLASCLGGPQRPPLTDTCPFHRLPLRVGQEGYFFSAPALVPPISWLLLSESQPSLCLGVQSSSWNPSERSAAARTVAAWDSGWEQEPRVLPADRPRQQGGGPYSDAPRHVPHAEREPPEAAHHEGVGAPHPSLHPPDPEFAVAECARLTDPVFCFCLQSQGHEEQAGHLQAAERIPWGPASGQGRQSDEVIQVGPLWPPWAPLRHLLVPVGAGLAVGLGEKAVGLIRLWGDAGSRSGSLVPGISSPHGEMLSWEG